MYSKDQNSYSNPDPDIDSVQSDNNAGKLTGQVRHIMVDMCHTESSNRFLFKMKCNYTDCEFD